MVGVVTRLLDRRRIDLREEERALIERLRDALAAFGAPAEDLAVLRQAADDLSEMFLLVVVGEFNAGKSAFINALVGAPVMPEGLTPTTNLVNILRWGEEPTETVRGEAVVERTYPAEFLREISVVDTPGTNAIVRRHEQITRAFIPRSDLVLFVTSVERPFSESERQFLELIREWGKKVLIILNKIDLIESETELAQVVEFVRDNVKALLGFAPEVWPVSARVAARAKRAETPLEREALLQASRFDALERHIVDTLDEANRIRLKLLSPLAVAQRLNNQYLGAVNDQLGRLAEDVKTNEQIEQQLNVYADDMRRDFEGRLSRINGVIYDLERRGDAFFDSTLRLGRIFDLFNAERTRGEFEREVIADTVSQLDAEVQSLIDWLVEREIKMWRSVTEFLNRRRRAARDEELIGQIGTFEYNRAELLQSVARRARDVIDDFDRDAEAKKLGDTMRDAVAQTAVAEVGAVSLGALVAAIVGTAAADITGILAAATIAGLGLYIIPHRRRVVRNEFRKRTEELRERLEAAMTDQFERELAASLDRIREAIAPYTRFVRAEQAKMETSRDTLAAIDAELRRIRQTLELTGSTTP